MITKRVIPIFSMVIYLPAFSYISIISLKAGFFVEGAIFAFAILILGTLCYRMWKELYLPKMTLRIFSGLLALVWAFTIFQRITFVLREGGMERADGYGSPLAFLLNIVYEAWCFGIPAVLIAIVAKLHRNPPKAEQDVDPIA
tara:strand:+ start:473 stop:901 length:429 start_codon:yes stop_codon:yes gene_type:complete